MRQSELYTVNSFFSKMLFLKPVTPSAKKHKCSVTLDNLSSNPSCDWISCQSWVCSITFIFAPQSITPILKTAVSGVVTTGKHCGWSLTMRLLGSMGGSVSVAFTENTKCPSREQAGGSVDTQGNVGFFFFFLTSKSTICSYLEERSEMNNR